MLFHFKTRYPALAPYWDKYLPYQLRREIPAKTPILEEGKISGHYIFIEQGCLRAYFNKNGEEKTVQFLFENEGLTSLNSFVNDTPSQFTIETLEPAVVYLLPKVHVLQLLEELSGEPGFLQLILQISADRQTHYIREFVSMIRDT